MIQLEGISKTYSGEKAVHALTDVNLHIPAGKIFGIIGPSGAGKSTLLRCINLLEKPDAGAVWVDGVRLDTLGPKELRQARQKMGMVFQHFNLLSSRTVAENVAFPLEVAKVSSQRRKQIVADLLQLVGLEDKANAYPAQLSGGQKQRVGIARALANEPRVLLCDEATSALDPETTKSVLQLLKSINQQLNLTIVVVTHEMSVIQEICDLVAVLDEGTVQECGPVVDVFTRPQAEATKRMLRGTFAANIPPELLSRTPNGHAPRRLLKLSFVGDKAHQPIISHMVQNCQVDANILFGRIDQMKDLP
ncbi:MAG TPA: ATP-binding cassette domain-containing protein, partial [Bacillota bacterium]|nr:ATP-binding cassette domain-containing protein [Bacillota bacterium]